MESMVKQGPQLAKAFQSAGRESAASKICSLQEKWKVLLQHAENRYPVLACWLILNHFCLKANPQLSDEKENMPQVIKCSLNKFSALELPLRCIFRYKLLFCIIALEHPS